MKKEPPKWFNLNYLLSTMQYSYAGEISKEGCFTFYFEGYLYTGDTISDLVIQVYKEFENDCHLVG